ncbi:MAG: hypothetical protein RL172_2543 [Bacteroidota bacterium]
MSRKFIAAALGYMGICLLLASHAIAQCSVHDITRVNVASITATTVTCPQNGSITASGVTGGGGEYVYELISGPIIRGIQSQPVFPALLPGKYRVRVTGCNGTFYESDTIIVPNQYLEMPMHNLRFVSNESFKCNTSSTGKVVINLSFQLPNGRLADTQLYSLPLQYQVSADPNPATGFTNAPVHSFEHTSYSMGWDETGTSPVGANTGNGQTRYTSMQQYDTITGLTAGATYYVRVTDQCGVYKTNSVTIPAVVNPVYTYSFQVKEPYILNTGSTDMPVMKGSCIQWGELTILQAGAALTTIPNNNTFFPLTAVLKRQDNGQVITTRVYNPGGLAKSTYWGYNMSGNNNLIFDSVPRVPVTLELTDQCGNTTRLNAGSPSSRQQFRLQAFTRCTNGNTYFYLNTINASPSLPVRFKLYDANNNLLQDKMMGINYQYVFLQGASLTSLYGNNQSTLVPAFGVYRMVYEDQCGQRDSLVYNFQPGGTSPQPSFSFRNHSPVCSATDGITRYSTEVVQVGTAPVGSIEISSGTGAIAYPKKLKTSSFVTFSGNGMISYSITKFFDSLPAGNYTVSIVYGCNQTMTTSFSVGSGTSNGLTATLSFTVTPNQCSSVGSSVKGEARITSTDISFVRNDTPCLRILSAPVNFLSGFSRSKDGSLPTVPYNLGAVGANSIKDNGIDTNAVNIYPTLTFFAMSGGWYTYPPGNYSFQLYGKCSGRILDTKSFVVQDAPYSTPNLGASSGYICDAGNPKVVVSPIGGRRPFSYQIKLASMPGETGYGALQSDSVFVLPASTPPGTVYTVRAVDACNNSFVGQVVVNSFTGNFYIASSNDCIGAPARIFTGYVPGATYTWTRPNGSTTVSNANELYFSELQLSDIGQYTVMINALNGCISRGAGNIIGNRCYSVLPVNFINFTAVKESNTMVNLRWTVNAAVNVQSYVAELSGDGIKWEAVAKVPAQNKPTDQTYNFLHRLTDMQRKPVLYYRVKALDADGKSKYTEIRPIYFSNEFSLIKVYPNPFRQAVSVDLLSEAAGQALVQLHDLSGREVSRSVMPVKKGINNYQYKPVLYIQPGNYMLTITQGTNRVTYQVIKQAE